MQKWHFRLSHKMFKMHLRCWLRMSLVSAVRQFKEKQSTVQTKLPLNSTIAFTDQNKYSILQYSINLQQEAVDQLCNTTWSEYAKSTVLFQFFLPCH